MWEPKGFALGRDRCWPTCWGPFKVLTFERRIVVEGPLILVMPVSGLHID